MTRVREAIYANAIETVYQPIVQLEDRRTVGYEALSRFRLRPVQDPSEWFAQAQSVGLGHELERATLTSALKGFDRLPPDCFLSVNLGPAALLNEDILAMLDASRPEQTVVELTQHARVDHYERLGNALLELRSRGLRLAVDDAGAGFASLRHVLKLAPDIIKIDGSLIQSVDHDRGARALTVALAKFAATMGQLVIAEGIERAETVEVLQGIDVHLGQGFLFAKPGRLPASRLHSGVQG